MKTPYDKYRLNIEWQIIDQSIKDLVDNHDLELKTSTDHVIGYISKQLVDKKNEIDFRTQIILSANRALLGAVTENLRGVTVDYSKDQLTLKAYFDKGATEVDKELIDIALTEMIADFKEINECKYESVDLFFPTKMTVLKDWVFMRNENLDEQK